MKFTLSWLKDYLDTTASLEQICNALTQCGLEVESVENYADSLKPFIVAEILEAEQHPQADRLRVCKVNNGSETLQIVCGAPNARAGIKVALASVGVVIPNGAFTIKKSAIRGVESNGMLCSATELNLGSDSEGIIELPQNAILGASIVDVLGLDDPVIDIAITPNRSDCLGVFGIARDLAASGLGTLKSEGVTNEEFQRAPELGEGDSRIIVSILDASCPFYIGCTIKEIRNGESPLWMQQRLKAIGQKPISALVDITNYLTIALGRPARVYDTAKLSGDINVRFAKQGEKLLALNDKEYALDSGMLVIADAEKPVALAGIIGGKESGVTAQTQEIFLEIALFDPAIVIHTGRKLQIDSDARYRFERYVAPSTLKHYLTATRMIQEICGGVASKPTIAGSLSMDRRTIAFDPNLVKKRTGMEIPREIMQQKLESLGFLCRAGNDGIMELGVPTWRPDVTIVEDIVEEIARLHGYAYLPLTPLPELPEAPPALSEAQQRPLQLAHLLVQRGLQEVVTFSFMESKKAALFHSSHNHTTLLNPISSELDHMRPSILPNLLDAAARNAARGNPNNGFFEIGPVFAGVTPDAQQKLASILRSGEAVTRNFHSPARAVDLFDAKADLAAMLGLFGMSLETLPIAADAPSYYHPGRSGVVKLGKQIVGIFGEVHPKILKDFDLKQPAVACELFIDALPAPKQTKSSARPPLQISPYPKVERDFAFLVDHSIRAEAFIKPIRQVDKNLITNVQIFDVYQGKNVPVDKKSVALSVTFEPVDRTLTEEEISKISGQITETIAKTLGGVLRV